MSEMYKLFVQDREGLDFSRTSLEQMYKFESQGVKFDNDRNGYFWGKKWMDVTISMWNEGLRSRLLCRYELEPEFPGWFLDKVLHYEVSEATG